MLHFDQCDFEYVPSRYETVDETAEAVKDYITKKGTVTFAPNETKKKIEIDIVDDNLVEEDEKFLLRLFLEPGNTKVVIGKRSIGEVKILNDDGMSCSKSFFGLVNLIPKYLV